MQDRILQVFYGNDRLPYKDKDRSIHYPITGNTFLGSSNVDKIRFYVRDIGGTNNITWVLNAKLPNGSILYQVLSTIGLDSDLGEYYVEFSVSQFYTQLKGDTYIALNGCDGDVTITTDSETNIQTITATIESQTILTTGVIKFSNNYAPQRPLGFSFDLDQYQTIIDALSSKANIANSIQVVANITSEDLSGYETGQLFYSLAQNLYYKKTASSPYYELADNGILASNKVIYRFGLILNKTFQDIHDVVGNKLFVITDLNNKEYLCYFDETVALPTNKYTISALYLKDMALYQIIDVDMGDNFTSLLVDANKTLYVKQTTNSSKIYGTTGLGEQTTLDYSVSVGANKIVKRNENGQVNVPLSPTQNAHSTSKKYVDDIDSALRDLIDTIVKNAFINVDTTTYPTLQSFLATTGQEGFIYLYPVNISDLSKGYYQYIWENNQWQDLGTTQIDLSNYYTKGETNSLLNGKLDKKTSGGLHAYTHNGSTQNETSVDNNASANTIPLRDNSGNIKVGTPSNNADATPKTYVDTLGSLKVDKTSSANKVYGTDDTGAQTTFGYDDYVDGDFVRRDSNGRIYAQSPIANGQVATKQYVDNGIASAISNVYKIKGSKTVAELNALTGQQVGDVYNLLDSGTLNAGNIQVFTGDNVVWLGSAWDKLGTEIDWTAYDEKFMSAGFFEVQNYNESTGEITMVYATELYDMNYNGDTGILSIEAN